MDIQAWFEDRVPAEWFEGHAEVDFDRDEVYVFGSLPELEGGGSIEERIHDFRESTRRERIRIARDAEVRFGRKVAWGVVTPEGRFMFTHLAIPAMTRLRLGERKVLDTLVDSGVARSRADALLWCVRFVAEDQAEWFEELRSALVHVEKVRSTGPVKA